MATLPPPGPNGLNSTELSICCDGHTIIKLKLSWKEGNPSNNPEIGPQRGGSFVTGTPLKTQTDNEKFIHPVYKQTMVSLEMAACMISISNSYQPSLSNYTLVLDNDNLVHIFENLCGSNTEAFINWLGWPISNVHVIKESEVPTNHAAVGFDTLEELYYSEYGKGKAKTNTYVSSHTGKRK